VKIKWRSWRQRAAAVQHLCVNISAAALWRLAASSGVGEEIGGGINSAAISRIATRLYRGAGRIWRHKRRLALMAGVIGSNRTA